MPDKQQKPENTDSPSVGLNDLLAAFLDEKSEREKYQAKLWEANKSEESTVIQFYLGKAEAFKNAAKLVRKYSS